MASYGIGSKVEHPTFGLGVVVNSSSDFIKIYFPARDEVKEIGADYDGLKTVERIMPEAEPIELRDIEEALRNVLDERSDLPGVSYPAAKWIGGTLVLKPGSDDLQAKEVPINTFFNKIIMVRERLRVLEQNINNHDKLDDADKLKLQQYITRSYGSLTTFNVLFAEEKDKFKGSGK